MPFVFLFAAAAVFCFFLGVAALKGRNPVAEMLRPSETGKAACRPFLKELWQAEDDLLPVGLTAALVAGAAVFGLVRFFPLALLAAFLSFVFIPRLYAQALAQRRKAAFLQHLARCVAGVCSVLRAGGSLTQALRYGAESVPDPVRSEVLRVLEEIESKSPVGEAARRMAKRVGLDEVGVLAEGLALLSDAGGPAGLKLLEGAVEFLKERALLRQKVLASTADVRFGFLVSSLVPFGLAGFMALAMPEYRAAFASPAGRIPFFLAVGLIVLGHVIVRRLFKSAEGVL
jgi:Flp pilus assembly protein TadB